MDAAHRLLAALIARDPGPAEALFAPSACLWWSQRGGLASVEGPGTTTRELIGLLEASTPTRLAIVANGAGSAVTSAYADDAIAWSLELRVEGCAIVGGYLRGAKLRLP